MSGAIPPAVDESLLRHAYVEVEANVRLHYVTLGDGPLVVLLHGFPEFWYAWRRQIAALAEAGFRVVAPDQRGSCRTRAWSSSRVRRIGCSTTLLRE